MKIIIKRAYTRPDASDGYRVLVDKLWPRGIKKESLELDEWCKEVAPSTELRKWFNHKTERFAEFRKKYQEELTNSSAAAELLNRAENTKSKTLTLVYAAKDPEHNHALVLKEYLGDN